MHEVCLAPIQEFRSIPTIRQHVARRRTGRLWVVGRNLFPARAYVPQAQQQWLQSLKLRLVEQPNVWTNTITSLVKSASTRLDVGHEMIFPYIKQNLTFFPPEFSSTQLPNSIHL